MDISEMVRDKKILITGGTGTVGKKLAQKLLELGAAVVRIYSRDEHKQFAIQEYFTYQGFDMKRIRFLLGDVRDKERLKRSMEDIDIIFHLAALKHVPACEYNPSEAVKTNVVGTQNVIECAMETGVSAVVYTSTDKAASPTNTMGASKLLAERLIASADHWKGPRHIKFLSVRFGNIINSRGSVVPLFQKQIERGGPVTVTEPAMSRFFMSVERAVGLILESLALSIGGETFVFKMPVLRVGDLARAVAEISGKDVEMRTIGLRPGEKMYEELMSEEESARALENDELFIILPYNYERRGYQERYASTRLAACGTYSSMNADLMSLEAIKAMLNGKNHTKL
ncbi:MAG: SDR family NAD(P)-dependent oxidoreductase [Syntrophomonas sp.]|nr:SDR family NAD(P)-dependent oxidoreductase [Syntrophomonas sp.]